MGDRSGVGIELWRVVRRDRAVDFEGENDFGVEVLVVLVVVERGGRRGGGGGGGGGGSGVLIREILYSSRSWRRVPCLILCKISSAVGR